MTRSTVPSLWSSDSPQSSMFQSLQKELDRVFDRFRAPYFDTAQDLATSRNGPVIPAVDIAETDEVVDITVEIPGVKEEDIDVSITDGILSLKGEKRSDREENEKGYHLVERRYGSFRRTIPLGFSPAADKVTATFTDGVLSLHIEKPKEAIAKTQKIAIKKS